VVEISSFMAYLVGRPQTGKLLAELAKVPSKNPEGIHFAASVFTNLETDHQNWHPDMADYLDAKLRVMRASDTSLVNSQVLEKAHSLGVKADFGKSKERVFGMNSAGLSTTTDSQRDQTSLRDRTDGENIIISGRRKYKLSETKFTGPHNAMNLLATGLVGNTLKICSKRTKKYFGEIE